MEEVTPLEGEGVEVLALKKIFEQKGLRAGKNALNREMWVTKLEYLRFKFEASLGFFEPEEYILYTLAFEGNLAALKLLRLLLRKDKDFRKFMVTPQTDETANKTR